MKDTQKWCGMQNDKENDLEGRPRRTWEDGIKDVLKRKGMAMTQAKDWAEDHAR
jgi:hypothetical protein